MKNPVKPSQTVSAGNGSRPPKTTTAPYTGEEVVVPRDSCPRGAVALRAATSPAVAVTVAPEPAAPEPTKIILDADRSAELDAAGTCFVVVARGSYPDAAGRMMLHLVPSTVEKIDKAVKVALGEARAVRFNVR